MKNKEIFESIENEINLLKSIIENPSTIKDESILSSLKDQKKFSNYHNIELKIKSYSLNSHKTYANKFLTEGYAYLNSLRIECLKTINNQKNQKTTSSKKTLISLQKTINEIKNENLILKKHNILLTDLTHRLIEKLDFYILNSKDNKIIYDYQDFKNQLECMVRFIELEV